MPVALPPGTGEAVTKAKLDRIFGEAEDDRDRRCCSFGRKCGELEVRRKDGIAFRFRRFWPDHLRRKSNCAVAHDRELELSETEPVESWHLAF
jgi:hypothetical protein